MEQEKLASELLHELKQSSKRWFVAFLVVLVLWFATIGAFIWYISLPVDECDYDIVQDATNGQRDIQIVGGSNYGETESEIQKETPSNQE